MKRPEDPGGLLHDVHKIYTMRRDMCKIHTMRRDTCKIRTVRRDVCNEGITPEGHRLRHLYDPAIRRLELWGGYNTKDRNMSARDLEGLPILFHAAW